jgi:anthranilate synthase/aminodeoxychorismate synthase-like glutamine amidotransferase
MIVMIDNFDSFTYNLVQYLRQLGSEVVVARNNALSVSEIEALAPRGIVISPGPGRPENAGVSMDVIRTFSGRTPLLGVCLGHQAIAASFGGRIVAARHLMHGKTSEVTADGRSVFKGIKQPFAAMRYHSLAVSRDQLPDCLEITAESDDGEIMGLRHREHPTEGLQFHPESIMTTVGKRLLRNFMRQCDA